MFGLQTQSSEIIKFNNLTCCKADLYHAKYLVHLNDQIF